jgi:hypothetical protein
VRVDPRGCVQDRTAPGDSFLEHPTERRTFQISILQINSYRLRLAPWTFLATWGKITLSLWGTDDSFSTGYTFLEVTPMKTNRLLVVMTFMSVLFLGTSLYAQQESDPTWYDPWPAADKVNAHISQPQAAIIPSQAHSQTQAKMVSSLREAPAAKVRSERSVSRRTSRGSSSTRAVSLVGTGSSSEISASSGNEVAIHRTGTEAAALNPSAADERVGPRLQP